MYGIIRSTKGEKDLRKSESKKAEEKNMSAITRQITIKNPQAEAYFKGINELGCQHEAKREAHKKLLQGLIDTYGSQSDEVRDWCKEDYAIKKSYPIKAGESQAYFAWIRSNNFMEEELEMNGFCWEKDVHDFVTTLRKAGIETFLFTGVSTAVMKNIHEFVKEGCTMLELCEVTRMTESCSDELKPEIHKGIRFKVN